MSDPTNTSHIEEWEDDLFHRRAFAQFLTRYLVAQTGARSGSQMRSFTLALDAGWGRGKTFFVERWARDLSSGSPVHPTMVFNAWASDFSSDPLIAFMAALRSALDREVKAAGLSVEAKRVASAKLRAAVAGARRAFAPALTQVAKGVFKKVTGVATDEIVEAIGSGKFDVDVDADLEEVAKGGLDALNKGLDFFFSKALAEETGRATVIEHLRVSIEETLRILVDNGGRVLPMFVFVDEVDRCRPSYAIALLEGLKHVFGVRGVCFVVSTHLEQLAEATRAVYGSGFDGRLYLKRFFDVECALPAPSGLAFAESLFSGSTAMKGQTFDLGLPRSGFLDAPSEATGSSAFAWVMGEFNFDLRSQQQVFTMIEAGAAALAPETVHLLWLIFLCALRYRNVNAFDDLAAAVPGRDLPTIFREERIATTTRKHQGLRPASNGLSRRETLETNLLYVAGTYLRFAHAAIERGRYAEDSDDYPAGLSERVRESCPNASRVPPLKKYFDVVGTAGFIRAGGSA